MLYNKYNSVKAQERTAAGLCPPQCLRRRPYFLLKVVAISSISCGQRKIGLRMNIRPMGHPCTK